MSALVLLESTARRIRELRALGQRTLGHARTEARQGTWSQPRRDYWARTFRDIAKDAFVQAARLVKDERRRFEGLDRLRFN